MSWAVDALREITEQVKQDDFSLCGGDTKNALCLAAQNLLAEQSRQRAFIQLDALIETAYAKLSSSLHVSPACWRRLYTDACILRSLGDARCQYEQTLLTCIARLDHAIIIAGAAGQGRLDFILDVIKRIQSEVVYSAPRNISPGRFSVSPPSSDISPLITSSNEIPSLLEPPSLGSFRSLFFRQPFILRGYIRDWPALSEHPWSSISYLHSVAGPGRVVPVEVGSDYRADDWTQKIIKWDDFLASLEPSHPTGDVLYLAQHNLFMQFPVLRGDILVPDYVYACPPPTPEFPGYKPPSNEDQLVINAWLGPKGTISPAHTDPYFNVYAQVTGRKTVWLAHPNKSSSMYPYPASESLQTTTNPAANNTNPSMSNTSRVDVFPMEQTNQRDYPEFRKKVVPYAMSAVLEPGDLLFFPPGWWHAMRSEDTSFSVSMWF